MNKFRKLGLIELQRPYGSPQLVAERNTKKCRALAGVSLTFPVLRLKNEVLSDVQSGAMPADVKA
jgi:hypothetical protein